MSKGKNREKGKRTGKRNPKESVSRQLKRKTYEKHLFRLQQELCHLQRWVQQEGLRVAVLFEGRSTADEMFDHIQAHRPTLLTSVPTMINNMLRSPRCPEADLSSLRVAPAIHRHRGHDDDSDQDLLHVGGPAHLLAAVAEEGHHQGSHHGAQDAALAPGEAAPADDHRCDHVELGPDGDRGVALSQPGHLHDPGEAEEEPRPLFATRDDALVIPGKGAGR